jgi:ATP-dependent 26S proteasome regulatory subunit
LNKRFDREVELPLPGVNERKQILIELTRDMPVDPSVDFGIFSKFISGF